MKPVMNIYEKFKADLKIVRPVDLLEIESLGYSMDFDEILAYYLWDEGELSVKEQSIIHRAIARGKTKGIAEATKKLFSNMSNDKTGAAACLSYLKRMSKEFAKDVDDSEGKDGVSFVANITVAKESSVESLQSADKKTVLKAV